MIYQINQHWVKNNWDSENTVYNSLYLFSCTWTNDDFSSDIMHQSVNKASYSTITLNIFWLWLLQTKFFKILLHLKIYESYKSLQVRTNFLSNELILQSVYQFSVTLQCKRVSWKSCFSRLCLITSLNLCWISLNILTILQFMLFVTISARYLMISNLEN